MLRYVFYYYSWLVNKPVGHLIMGKDFKDALKWFERTSIRTKEDIVYYELEGIRYEFPIN